MRVKDNVRRDWPSLLLCLAALALGGLILCELLERIGGAS